MFHRKETPKEKQTEVGEDTFSLLPDAINVELYYQLNDQTPYY